MRMRSRVGQRGALAGGAAGHEEVDAGLDLAAAEPADALLVELARSS